MLKNLKAEINITHYEYNNINVEYEYSELEKDVLITFSLDNKFITLKKSELNLIVQILNNYIASYEKFTEENHGN